MSLEMPAESVGTVAGVQSWRTESSRFCEMWQRSYEHLVICVWMERWVDWYWRSLGNEQECESTGITAQTVTRRVKQHNKIRSLQTLINALIHD